MMKKFAIFLLLQFAIFANVNAQSNNISIDEFRELINQKADRFLTFKGIELRPGIRMKDFVNQLESKGLKRSELSTFIESKSNTIVLEGTFFNTRDCNIHVIPTSQDNNIVGIIGVSFPNRDSFWKLKAEYDQLKASLSEKYTVSDCVESFDDDYIDSSTSDFLKLNALSNDEGHFETRFVISNEGISSLCGYIFLSIKHLEVDYKEYYYVSLSYRTPDNLYEQVYSRDDDL